MLDKLKGADALDEMEMEDSPMDDEKSAMKDVVLEVLMQLIQESEAASGKMISDDMEKMKMGDMGDMKEVTVAAEDEEGLEEGLDMAEELIGKVDDEDEEEDDDEDTMY